MTATRRYHVACAIIERDGYVLAAQRGASMSLPLKWEFPGGKIDPGESPEECLRRELREELQVEIVVVAALPGSDWSYPDFSVTLYPFVARIVAGEPLLIEHHDLCWLQPHELPGLDWAEADLPVLKNYEEYRRRGR